MAKQCWECKCNSGGVFSGNHESLFASIKGKDYCQKCAQKIFNEVIGAIPITTTHSIEGYTIKRYIDIESVEVVMGTGVFSEFAGDISDFFGARSTGFELKLQNAKKAAFSRLKSKAYEQGGNAVVGIDIDYTEFTGNRIGVIANGTIVEIEKI